MSACAGMDVNLFFPPGDAYREEDVRVARQVCLSCPSRLECLDAALAEGDVEYGVRGGLTPDERRRYLRRLPMMTAQREREYAFSG